MTLAEGLPDSVLKLIRQNRAEYAVLHQYRCVCQNLKAAAPTYLA